MTLVLATTFIGVSGTLITILVGHPISDDYAALNYYHPSTWLQNASNELMNTGRYGQSILSSTIYGFFRAQATNIVPISVALWFLVLLYLFMIKAQGLISANLSRIDAFVAALIVYVAVVTANSAPEQIDVSLTFPGFPEQGVLFSFENFFWTAGAITYTVPLLLLLSLIYIFSFRYLLSNVKLKTLLFSLFSFLVMTTNETLPATVTMIAFALLVVSLFPFFNKTIKKIRVSLFSLMFSGLFAFITLVLSPGSTQRQGVTGVKERLSYSLDSLAQLLQQVINVFNSYVFSTSNRSMDWLLFIAIAYIFGSVCLIAIKSSALNPKTIVKYLISFGFLSIIIGLCSALMSFTLVNVGYGTSQVIPRTLLIPQLLITVGKLAFLTGLAIFVLNRKSKILHSAVIIFVAVAALFSFPSSLENVQRQIINVSSYSASWNNLESEFLKSDVTSEGTVYLVQHGTNLLVEPTITTPEDIPYCDSWYFEAIAKYYGINKFCTVGFK